MTGSDYLTTSQVCEIWPFLMPATLRYWRHSNSGPASIRVGRRVLYTRSGVEEWIAAQAASSMRGGVA